MTLTIWPDLCYGCRIIPRYVARDAPCWQFELKRCQEHNGETVWDYAGSPSTIGTPDFEDGLVVAKGWIYQRRLLELHVEDACFEGAEDLAQFGEALLRVNALAEELRRAAAAKAGWPETDQGNRATPGRSSNPIRNP